MLFIFEHEKNEAIIIVFILSRLLFLSCIKFCWLENINLAWECSLSGRRLALASMQFWIRPQYHTDAVWWDTLVISGEARYWVQWHLQLYRQFQAHLDYMRSCLKFVFLKILIAFLDFTDSHFETVHIFAILVF